MKVTHTILKGAATFGGLAATLLLTTGCGGKQSAPLTAAGSSFVNPIMTKWASTYNKEKGLEVNYQSTGSGNGIQQMTSKTVDFGCSDAPMNDEQLQTAEKQGGRVLHIPLVMGGVVPAYNLPGLDKPLQFTGQVLADIFTGKIKKWNDPALTALNEGVPLPDKDILVIYRSDASGTNYIWVDYLNKASKDWKLGVKTSVAWPVGEGAKGSEGVAGKLGTEGTIGYVELLYALQKQIKYGSVQNKAGAFVQASLESVTAAADHSLSSIPDDLRYSLTDAPGKDSYPIGGTTWAVLYARQPEGKGQEVVAFLRWVLHEGQDQCARLQYARLSPGLVEKASKQLDGVTFAK